MSVMDLMQMKHFLKGTYSKWILYSHDECTWK